jgi:hypothetical protein
MTDRELLQQALDVLTSVAITKRSGVTDNGSAVLPFEVLIECADMVSAIGTRLAQPKKEWVGLTDEEVKQLSDYCVDVRDEIEFIRAIEEEIKEKNSD